MSDRGRGGRGGGRGGGGRGEGGRGGGGRGGEGGRGGGGRGGEGGRGGGGGGGRGGAGDGRGGGGGWGGGGGGGGRGRGDGDRRYAGGDGYEKDRRGDGQSDRGRGSYEHRGGGRGFDRGGGRGFDRGGGRGFDSGGGRGGDRGGFRGRGGHHEGATQFVPPVITQKNFPKEKSHGIKGKNVVLETNYLALNVGNVNNLKIYQYDVTIEPDRFKKLFVAVMDQFKKTYFPNKVLPFDGSKFLLSRERLRDITEEIEYKRYPDATDSLKFKVKVKYTKEVDMSFLKEYNRTGTLRASQDASQILSIILRGAPLLKYISVGRNFYSYPNKPIPLGFGMELLYGLHQAPFLADRGPLINVNLLHKSFPMGKNLLELFEEICSKRISNEPLTGRDLDEILNVIRDKKVEYSIGGKMIEYSVNGFKGSPKVETISTEGCTVFEYFDRKKNYKIKCPNIQLLWVGNKQKDPPILIPVELCSLKRGQAPKRSANENSKVISTMIKHTATNTQVRKDRIKEMVQTIGDYDNSEYLREFGFTVSKDFELVNGRILNPPQLQYKTNVVNPSKGQWDLRDKSFLTSPTINNWVVINLDYYVKPQQIHNLQKQIVDQARAMGMQISNPHNLVDISASKKIPQDLKTHFEERKTFDFILVIFSEKSNLYATVKQQAELNVGCLTQCLLTKTIERSNSQSTIANLLLKINTKLNGTNHRWAVKPTFLKDHCMIMGADVTHPAPQNRDKIPSFAAVTASHDVYFYKYNTICQMQPARQEMIEDLKSILADQLKFHYKHTQKKPDHIIFFRDGVAEGQFDDIKEYELKAIKQACAQMPGPKYEPKITFIVVMKRHHTRLFPTDQSQSYDRNFNVPAGTCVDSGITHPACMGLKDFYLASHSAIQGVTKPTKYCTIYDDAKLSYDDIEELAYFLCHMYSRCARSVSYPAPTYYAHLAAERAKKLYEKVEIDFQELEKLKKKRIKVKIADPTPMFFV